MYTCSRCKNTYEADAPFSNACGDFCHFCKEFIHKKAVLATKAANKAKAGSCVWCHKPMAPELWQAGKEVENVCRECEAWRRKTLDLSRVSDRPFKYISRVEEREKPNREARERELTAKAQAPQTQPAKSDDSETRLQRLESALAKIAEKLGV